MEKGCKSSRSLGIPLLFSICFLVSIFNLTHHLPAFLSFPITVCGIVLLPGMVLTEMLRNREDNQSIYAEDLLTWFVLGIFVITCVSLVGITFHLRLSTLVKIVIVTYCVLGFTMFAKFKLCRYSNPYKARSEDHRNRAIPALLFLAAGMALVTILTPRDFDDWYYLGYIRDFLAQKPIGLEDAIFDLGKPAPTRIWFGGAWWIAESFLTYFSGIDPVTCHQTYVPLLMMPVAIFAFFALTRQLFRTNTVALMAVYLQTVFYLSSSIPLKTVGWFFLCRLAQDKAVCFFIMVPFATALALQIIKGNDSNPHSRLRLRLTYWFVTLTSALTHGMGPIWAGLTILPFALVETLRMRSRRAVLNLGIVALPIACYAAIVIAATGHTQPQFEAPGPEPVSISEVMRGPYLPASSYPDPIESRHPIVRLGRPDQVILNPLFVIRYPMAIAALILTMLLIPRIKGDMSCRFAVIVTTLVLLLTYTPTGANLAARFISYRLLFRLSWLLPWGIVIAIAGQVKRAQPSDQICR